MAAYITKGRAELETTDLGGAAFDGRLEDVRAALRAGVDWMVEGQQPLIGALYGEHRELARELLRSGMPITDETYQLVLTHDRSLLDELPPRSEVVADFDRKAEGRAFQFAVFQGDLATARALISKPHVRAVLEVPTLFAHGIGAVRPLHYAARIADVDLLRLLVDAGADVNALTDAGKSPLRLVAECAGVENARRREAIRLLSERGATFVPRLPGGPIARWMYRRGEWLAPG